MLFDDPWVSKTVLLGTSKESDLGVGPVLAGSRVFIGMLRKEDFHFVMENSWCLVLKEGWNIMRVAFQYESAWDFEKLVQYQGWHFKRGGT